MRTIELPQYTNTLNHNNTMRKFLKRLFLLVIGIMAGIMIVAEGENERTTAFIKLSACVLIAAGLLLHKEWNEEENFNKKKGESHGA